MTNITLLGVNILLLIGMWRTMLRRTALDTCRDELFDLREQTHRFFAARGELKSHVYANLRVLLNNYIRFAEEATFARVFVMAGKVAKNRRLHRELRAALDAKFASRDAEVMQFTRYVRGYSCHTVQRWVFHSSFYSCALFYLLLGFYNLVALIRKLKVTQLVEAFMERPLRADTLEVIPQAMCPARFGRMQPGFA